MRIWILVYGLLYIAFETVGYHLEQVGWTEVTSLDVATALTDAFLAAAIAAAGYDADHELIRFGVPSLFVPMARQTDDQAARARFAAEQGVGLATEPGDAGLEAELDADVAALEGDVESLRIRSLLSGPDDHRDAQLEISAGAGGTEAQDWAQMLMRMYTRWAERRGYAVEVLDLSEGEEAGIKGAVLEIRGPQAYGLLKGETGVHRLVRISPFDAQARRHTSFASVFVYPVVNEEINVEIREEDIKMDVFRASGAGGQHVNKTSSAVRLTHLPTGIVVASQQERSQHKNRATALKMLRNRLYQLAVEKQQQKKAELDATKADVTFGSQIRSYVFQPYTMVNDHRTELKIPDVHRVMDGDIDAFIEAYLKKHGGSPVAA